MVGKWASKRCVLLFCFLLFVCCGNGKNYDEVYEVLKGSLPLPGLGLIMSCTVTEALGATTTHCRRYGAWWWRQ